MGMQEAARFECGGDVRVVSFGEEEGQLVVREDVSGPTVELVFGEAQRSQRMSFSPKAAAQLLAALGFSGEKGALWERLCDEGQCLADLMDVCDMQGIPYTFCGIGSSSGVQFRAAA